MKRLEIALIGSSRALDRLTEELESLGHGVQRPYQLDAAPSAPLDLVIEDGSMASEVPCGSPQLRLRADGFDPVDPRQTLWLVIGVSLAGQPGYCLEQLMVEGEASGNGADLVSRAIGVLVDSCVVHVSAYSRHDQHFLSVAGAQLPLSGAPLLALDRLAYRHVHNATHAPHILELARESFVKRLSDSLLAHADRAALLLEDRAVSYAELHAMSLAVQERLAPLLEGQGACAPIVAISLPKGLALYASILAVLGCGATYLPLDPNHPAERRSRVIEHARARVLIHDGQALGPARCAMLDASQLSFMHHGLYGEQRIALGPHQHLLRVPQPDDFPCVTIYTSGTTGQPKGVQLTQGNLSHFCAWYADHVQLHPDCRVLQFSTINFDASMLDLFPTLIEGACLVVPTEDQRRDPVALGALMRAAAVSHAFLPPALLSIMPLESLYGVAHVVTGGDVCEPHVIEALVAKTHLHNIYGPTETTILATSHALAPGDSNRLLGRPIANTRILLLDEQGLPVGEGVTGEIYIAGPGVGAGYLENPQATAERYCQLPADPTEGRLYRTGDLARWVPAGLEILGRLDNQVKIRGFRVEPEEIEHTLRLGQHFNQLAVVVDDSRRVMAFFAQPRLGDTQAAIDALKAHAEETLPDYMRPVSWRLLERLPATVNGKVDRRALRQLPDEARPRQVRSAPLTATQASLLALWSTLLELPEDDIGLQESFFNLGGHSILLSQMLMGIRETFGKGVSINRFIEQPTLANLARMIELDEQLEAQVSPRALEDALQCPELDILPASRLGDVHKVIVTGANGFLGVHLVEALLDLGSTEVACLVREAPGQSAQARFEQALRDNRLEHLDLSRVRVIAGDISQSGLGIDPQVYEQLDRDYGALIYNAANVNHVLDYESLIKDNVTPVLECLKLCEGRSKKIFNFISTLSASSSMDETGRVLEVPPAATPPIYIRNGYNVSKWVAERILWNACERGAWVNLYRPGNIAFNTRTGVCQPHQNRLMLMLKGSLQLKEVPQLSLNFDLMPVDFLARFIAFHGSRHQRSRAVFNLHNPLPLSWERYVQAFREAGHDFRLVPIQEWQKRLSAIGSDNALFGVVGFYLNGFEEDIGDISLIEHGNARSGIDNMGEQYPAKSESLLQRGCQFLKDIDFI